MASIFTYEPDPPRVASPWNDIPQEYMSGFASKSPETKTNRPGTGETLLRLRAEPQEGPVEYKLHLLLRPRRKFTSISTTDQISGSKHSHLLKKHSARSPPESVLDTTMYSSQATPIAASTQQMRQHRLQQLTTQLLWRLQQSSPHHSSSANNYILPTLPDALPELEAPGQVARLLHGLEESQGALYEIGVADDGTLVGLAEDEMSESLNNLRAMAACLGCTVEVLREESVGECRWLADDNTNGPEHFRHCTGTLVVVEVFVKPHLHEHDEKRDRPSEIQNVGATLTSAAKVQAEKTEQLRVSLAGPTMSGKSTLLGTLTTSTLDNGRGQSRLSMLKHQHEISSGITSSVTQELFGYTDDAENSASVVNFAAENIASWIDLHAACAGNRLVLVSDSAGHPRYRRTTVRSLIGWAPHWTLLCVPADDMEDTSGKMGSTTGSQQSLGPVISNMDLSSAQLDLCLRLALPLVVIITKLDLASKNGLRETLSKILDALKAAKRKPVILPNAPGDLTEEQLQHVPGTALEGAYKVALPLLNNRIERVPIVLTSAVQGTGMQNLHALLNELPMPSVPAQSEKAPSVLFHVEDVYRNPAEVAGVIVSGYLRFGQISVGETLTLGPFLTNEHLDDSEDSDEKPLQRLADHLPTSRSFPGALKGSHFAPSHLNFSITSEQWRRVKVTSIRNLRLPVHSLHADQVGTLAVVPDNPHQTGAKADAKAALVRIRKGMVIASIQPLAAKSFVAEFQREDFEGLAVGNHVVTYIASVRASAKILSVKEPDLPLKKSNESAEEWSPKEQRHGSSDRDPFALDEVMVRVEGNGEAFHQSTSTLLITFLFDSTKEFVAIGEKVLIMTGSGQTAYGGQERGQKGIPGLEGFVGIIREAYG